MKEASKSIGDCSELIVLFIFFHTPEPLHCMAIPRSLFDASLLLVQEADSLSELLAVKGSSPARSNHFGSAAAPSHLSHFTNGLHY